MKKKTLILTALFLTLFSSALAIDKPKSLNHLEAVISTSGTVKVIGGEMKSLEINSTIPQPTETQKVNYFNNTIKASDGDTISHIKRDNPEEPFNYTIITGINNSRQKITSIPNSYSLPSYFAKYLESTEKIQSDDPEIKQFAKKITKNATTDFEKLALLASWNHKNVDYDMSMIGQKKDASWVLENQKGVCVEHTVLFMAMARSLGYPTRYVSGMVFGSKGWLSHAWAEVYIGKWIGFDPTWLEAGGIDATHMIFSRSTTSDVSSRVSARTTGGKIDWTRPNLGEKLTANEVKEISSSYIDGFSPSSFEVTSETLGFGEKAVIYLEMEPEEYQVMDLQLVPCSGKVEPLKVEDPVKSAVLAPEEKNVVAWTVKANENLEEKTIYSCPVQLYSSFLDTKGTDVKVKKNPTTEVGAWARKSEISPGENQTIYVDTTGISQGAEVGIVTEKSVKEKEAEGKQVSFEIKPEKLGLHEVHAFTSEGGARKVSYYVGGGNITINSVNTSKQILPGQEFGVTISVENTDSAEQVRLEVAAGTQRKIEKFVLEGERTLKFSFNATEDVNSVTTVLSTKYKEITYSLPVKKYIEPELIVKEKKKVSEKKALLEFEYKGNPVSPVMYVNEKKVLLAGHEKIEINLQEGTNEIKILWTDDHGKDYSKTFYIDSTPEKKQKASIINQIWPLAIAIGFLLFIGMLYLTYLVTKAFSS